MATSQAAIDYWIETITHQRKVLNWYNTDLGALEVLAVKLSLTSEPTVEMIRESVERACDILGCCKPYSLAIRCERLARWEDHCGAFKTTGIAHVYFCSTFPILKHRIQIWKNGLKEMVALDEDYLNLYLGNAGEFFN